MTTRTDQSNETMITLKEACDLTGKSEVTIRRLVKKNKVTSHKEKSATGFIYLIGKESLITYYKSDYSKNDQTTNQTNQTIDQANSRSTSQEKNIVNNSPINNDTHTTSQVNSLNDQATSQTVLKLLQDEIGRLREELKEERQKKEEKDKEKEERISKLQEEIGKLMGQVGFWEGKATAFEQQVRYLQAPKQPESDTKSDSEPEIITVTSKTEQEHQSSGADSKTIKQNKRFNLAFWIITILVLSGLSALAYAIMTGQLKF